MRSRAHVRPDHDNAPDDREIWSTSRGYSIEILGLSPMYLDAISQGMLNDPDWPDPETKHPTYEAKTVAGDVEIHKHDQESIDDPRTPDADRTLWREYKLYTARFEAERTRRIIDGCLLEGIKLLDVDASASGWIARQKKVGIQVPDDPLDQELHFIRTMIVGNVDDLRHIMDRVMTRTGLDRRTLDNASAMFPGEVESVEERSVEGDTA